MTFFRVGARRQASVKNENDFQFHRQLYPTEHARLSSLNYYYYRAGIC